MRYLIRHTAATAPLVRSAKKDARLVERLVAEFTDARAARAPLDAVWMEARRQYAGIPKRPFRNQPIPNAPNLELPIGALICDSLYAQVTDTLYQAQPILTAREMDAIWEEHARAIQRFVNWMAANELGLRFATDNAFQDNIQLGTGVLYCPWVREARTTTAYRVVYESPRLVPISPEDFLVPGGSRGDHQQDPWVSIRFWYTPGEFAAQAREQRWDTSRVKPVTTLDRVRVYHEHLGHTTSQAPGRERFAVENVWIHHDYDGDGVERDLHVVFDFENRALLAVGYNRLDTRPIETMRYQVRPHLFWGLGVLEMGQPLQEAGSETMNHFLLNMLLVNGRMYATRHGVVDDFTKVWPFRIVGVDSIDDIKELRLSDVYPSILAGLDRLIQLYERRVGVTGEFTSGSPASRVLGTRTPGITAMSALQSVNRRFAPAFDGMRLNTAAAVRQCLWRYAERIRAKDARVRAHVARLLGERDAARVEELFRQDDFERAVAVEFTAVSPSVNREADRTNAMLLMQQLGGYNQQVMAAMLQLAQAPDPTLHEVAKKVLRATNFAMEDFLRTFDQVRNPQRLLVDIEPELTQAQEAAAEAQAAEAVIGPILQAITGGNGAPAPVDGGAPPMPE